MRISIRYFGAAQAAAGVEADTRTVEAGTSVAELTRLLTQQNPRLATVLARCSYLCDGVAVRDTSAPMQAGQTIDVLPPFAGG
ncbi:MAG: MoaD/ThiS family protein [Candidatus Sericytochromatia bacterium]